MTHPLNIPYMEENEHLEGQGLSPDPPCLSAPIPQSGLRIGKETSKPCAGWFGIRYFIKI